MKLGPARAAETLVRTLPQLMRFLSVAYGTLLVVDALSVPRAGRVSGGVRPAGEVATELAIRSSTLTGLVEPLHRQRPAPADQCTAALDRSGVLCTRERRGVASDTRARRSDYALLVPP